MSKLNLITSLSLIPTTLTPVGVITVNEINGQENWAPSETTLEFVDSDLKVSSNFSLDETCRVGAHGLWSWDSYGTNFNHRLESGNNCIIPINVNCSTDLLLRLMNNPTLSEPFSSSNIKYEFGEDKYLESRPMFDVETYDWHDCGDPWCTARSYGVDISVLSDQISNSNLQRNLDNQNTFNEIKNKATSLFADEKQYILSSTYDIESGSQLGGHSTIGGDFWCTSFDAIAHVTTFIVIDPTVLQLSAKIFPDQQIARFTISQQPNTNLLNFFYFAWMDCGLCHSTYTNMENWNVAYWSNGSSSLKAQNQRYHDAVGGLGRQYDWTFKISGDYSLSNIIWTLDYDISNPLDE